MATINTNMAANIASNAMTRNERLMSATMERLSTGLRINSAKDDAAGLAISSKMTSQIRGLNQAVRNANDAISMIQVGEGALKEATNMLQRMRELAIQASSDSNTANDRTALNNEFTQLRDELSRVNANTEWNGTAIFSQAGTSSTAKTFQVGANASQTVDVTFKNFDAGSSTTDAATGSVFHNLDTNGSSSTAEVSNFDMETDAKATAITAVNFSDGTTTIQLASSDLTSVDTMAKLATAVQAKITASPNFAFNAAIGTGGDDHILIFTAKTGGDVASVTASGITGSGTSSLNQTAVAHVDGTGAKDINNIDITSRANADEAMFAMSDAIDQVNSQRALLGASMSRLEYASDNLQNVAQNTAAARSRVLDADYASETTELARTQIIQQAATAMLAQANQSQQSVLALLRSS